jgi:hypothetical protein
MRKFHCRIAATLPTLDPDLQSIFGVFVAVHKEYARRNSSTSFRKDSADPGKSRITRSTISIRIARSERTGEVKNPISRISENGCDGNAGSSGVVHREPPDVSC